jgi:putative redox protein
MIGHQARAVLRDGMHFEAFTNDPDAERFAIQLDADDSAGGQDRGMRPSKLLLARLAGCMGMDVISILRKKRQEITALEVGVDGQHAEEHPMVYQRIQVRFTISGKQIDQAAVERAIELSYTKYCPIANLLKPIVPVETSYEIKES